MSLTVRVRHRDEDLALTLSSVPACDVEFALEEGDDKNAYAAGKRIVSSKG